MAKRRSKLEEDVRRETIYYAFSDLISWLCCKKAEPTVLSKIVWRLGGRKKFHEELCRLLGYTVTTAGIGIITNSVTREKLLNFLEMGMQSIAKDTPPLVADSCPYVLASAAILISSNLLIKSKNDDPKPSRLAQSCAKTALGSLYCVISAALNIAFDFLLLNAGLASTSLRLALSTCLATCTWIGLNELSKTTNEKGISMVKLAKATAYSFAGNIESTFCCASR